MTMFLFPTTFTVERLLKRLKKQEDQLHHPILDTLLSWMIAVVCFIYYGFRYVLMKWKQRCMQSSSSSSSSPKRCWCIPLMTHSRTELDRHSLPERLQQLQTYLHHQHQKPKANGSCCNGHNHHQIDWSDEELIVLIRSQEIPRRLASLVIVLLQRQRQATNNNDLTELLEDDSLLLLQQLQRIWLALLPLPPVPSLLLNSQGSSCFTIALIIPAYREHGHKIQRVLTKALMACHSPQDVQVIVMDAGDNKGLDDDIFVPSCQSSTGSITTTSVGGGWGQVQRLVFTEGGGRGPCLNYGARHAKALLYTFLHSDTTLPHHWDKSVKQALLPKPDTTLSTTNCSKQQQQQQQRRRRRRHTIINHACAFSFGINTTPEGLDGGCYPYGIQSIQSFLGNLRANLFKLPYGDHVISIAASTFWFLGGYPDQPLMEDYELMHLLRQRSSLLYEEEQLAILQSRGYCSPRRWQRYGVPYVTLANAYCVYQYECGMTPDDLYRYYYGQAPPQRKSKWSPWEIERLSEEQQQQQEASVATTSTTTSTPRVNGQH